MNKTLLIASLIGSIVLAVSSCGKPDGFKDPDDFGMDSPYPGFRGGDVKGEKNFATLINQFKEAKVEPYPWAGFWWPYTGNGIANGSHGRGSSPAGKYDAARGGRTNAQNWEANYHGSRVKGVQGWWGHCNGWCVAAALFPEPRDSVKVNGITFGVSDLKALLTELGMSASADFYGNRVDWGNDYATPKYGDTVPDQYFLVLTNYIGKLKQAVLIDRFTGDQVWNQPLAGYRFEYPTPADYLGADPQAPNIYRINLTSTIWWGRDDVPPDVLTHPFNYAEDEHYQARTLQMELWVDAPIVFGPDGKIQSSGNVVVTRQGDYHIGGAWRIGDGYFADGWPDYMWVPYSVVKPTDPEQDYANAHVDVDWVKKHLLVAGGADDTSVNPRPIEPAPVPCPTPSPSSRPSSNPYPQPTSTIQPNPNPQPRPTRTSTPTPTPTPTRTTTPQPTPTPRPTSTSPWPFPDYE